ncbi:MAG TPA: carbamoyltransferase [Casimicrobiaceae bacterium]|nr:carbamoyltransferase [Casimicrobiaceae bacterium]
MHVLGISAFYHDSAACLVEDGKIVAAAQEERFSRKRHDARFPGNALRFCLRQAGIEAKDADRVVFYDKPFLKFERLLETYFAFAPRGFRSFRVALPIWLREKLFLKSLLESELRKIDPDADWSAKLLFGEHHLSHAASAFFPSPFESAAVLTLDGVGEWATSSVAIGEGNHLEVEREIHFPHSLGLLYSAFTYYTGFKVNSGEYKVMGLAPYGQSRYVDLIYSHLVDVKEDGSFRLNQEYFDYCTGLTMTNGKFAELFGGPPRDPAEPLTQKEMDLAASIQKVTDEIMLKLTRAIARDTGQRNLCLAGGVALNCVSNGKILRDRAFERLWVQPAAGDAGGAVGAALAAYHGMLDRPRHVSAGDSMQGSFLGPEFSQTEIETMLATEGGRFEVMAESELIARCARELAQGKAVGWFQGRMEFGPRALGARSILGDPRSATMQRTLNLKIKHRESFRPFAPSVLRDDVADWFELDDDSPYMSIVADVAASRRRGITHAESSLQGLSRLGVIRSEIPAVTHVDGSARIQTVARESHPRYHALLAEFKRQTGCPVLVNTSFNVRGEPIVCSPTDAFRCFMATEIDALAIGDAYLSKPDQDARLKRDYTNAFEPD